MYEVENVVKVVKVVGMCVCVGGGGGGGGPRGGVIAGIAL